MLITGPKPDALTIRRSGMSFAVGVRVVAIRVLAGSKPTLGAIDRVDVATIGALDDLPKALRRLRAA
jgi:hypothetical protein